MRSIGTRFSVAVGGLALVFSGIVLYRAWSSAKQQTEALISAEAKLALEFDLAIRDYVKDTIRPEMEKRVNPDEFVVEAMSTSYVAREIVEKVRKEFPEYLLKFPSDNPRNPQNMAGPEELERLQYFRSNPDKDRWAGRLKINDTEYFAHVSAMRVVKSCLHCHGLPEDCPKSLLERYPSNGGFYHKVGDVAGMDMIAIPMDVVNASLASHARANVLATAAWLAVLFGSILTAFRLIVGHRLSAITEHFQTAAAQESGSVSPVPDSGKDEISVLAQSFNSLANRLQTLHGSLEHQVRERTEELATTNNQLRDEIDNRRKVEEALRREQRLLKQALRMHDYDRQVIAYEIHDGLAQDLFAAMMALQSFDCTKPQEAQEKLKAGIAMLTKCTAEARRLINGVRPPLLDEQGVVLAVENLICELSDEDCPEIEFHYSEGVGRLEPVLENAIYRIVQEGISNARHHSKTDRIKVSLEREDSRIRLEVQDWGIGFDMNKIQGHSIGLNGIEERAKSLGGKAVIESSLGSGTKVVVDLPIQLP
jgi:signal transduction histidine kinase